LVDVPFHQEGTVTPAWPRSAVVLLCGLVGAALLGRPTVGSASGGSSMVVTSESQARHCAQYTASTLRALEKGAQRLVLVVHSFTPPDPSDGTLVVRLANSGKPSQEVARVAIHPVRGFARAAGKEKRFGVSLADQPNLPPEGTPLCLEVGFDTAQKRKGGRAEIDIVLEGASP
jgi:hypothetical protein